MRPLFDLVTAGRMTNPLIQFPTIAVIVGNLLALSNSYLDKMDHLLRTTILLTSAIVTLCHALPVVVRSLRKLRKPKPIHGPKRVPSRLPIFTLLSIICFLPVFSGCTVLRTATYDASTGKVTGHVTAYSFFDSQTALHKLRLSKTGTSIGDLSQEANGTNATAIVSAGAEGIMSALLKFR